LADRITDHAEKYPDGFKSEDASEKATVMFDTHLVANPECFTQAVAAHADNEGPLGGGGDEGAAEEEDDGDDEL
jgi:hypothetical protein